MKRLHPLVFLFGFVFTLLVFFILPYSSSRAGENEDATILYLADEMVARDTDDLRSVDNLQRELPLTYVPSWEEFDLVEAASMEALIIDVSVLDDIDNNAIAQLYRQGVVIASFNIPVAEFADLLNDRCILNDEFASEPYRGSYFVIASQLTLGDLQQDVERILIGRQSTCVGGAPGVAGYVTGYQGRATSTLDTEDDLHIFSQVLLRQVQGVRDTYTEFQENSLLQLPIKGE
jgi:hypothetical protein